MRNDINKKELCESIEKYMKEVFLLTKILLKSSMNSHNEKKSKKASTLKIFGWFFLYLYIAGIVGFLSYEVISALKIVNQEAVFLNLCLVILLGMNIIRSLFSSMNMLFFSKDTEFLLPLPIQPYKIVMAKMNCLVLSEYIICLLIALPALCVYGYILQLSLWFYICGILVMLLLPIVPVLLISFIMTVIMKFTNIIRNKDFVQYITIILSLALILGVQFLTGMDQQITNEELANMLIETNGLVEVYTKYFFTLKPAMQILIHYDTVDGILNLCLLIVETVMIAIFVIKIMSSFYIKTVTNTTTSVSNKKKKGSIQKTLKKKTIIKAYVKKEFQNLVRNPIFFMQCVLPSILFPFIFLIPIYMGLKSGEIGELENIKLVIADGIKMPSGIAISVAILIFFYMFNYISITSVSRDGENVVFMKYIPISLEKQCLYKILPGIIMNLVPALYLTIGVKFLLPNVDIVTLLWINVIAVLLNILNNYGMIIIDLKRPKLHWTTEYAVVKQNMNMLWEMILCILQIIIILFWGFFVQSIQLFAISICVFLIVGIMFVQKYIRKNANKLFEKII